MEWVMEHPWMTFFLAILMMDLLGTFIYNTCKTMMCCANRKGDASPVGHAKWIDIYKNFETAECSSCHSQFEVTFGGESHGALWDVFKHFYKYCPNCGAKMDLEEE